MRRLLLAALIVATVLMFGAHYQLVAQPIGPAMDGEVQEVVCE